MGSSNRIQDMVAEKFGHRHEHDPDFKGPMKEGRSCTDIICLLLFIVYMLGWIAVGIYGFMHGNPWRIIYPSNSDGDICGSGDLSDKPYLLFFDLSRCAKPTVSFSGCPTPQVKSLAVFDGMLSCGKYVEQQPSVKDDFF